MHEVADSVSDKGRIASGVDGVGCFIRKVVKQFVVIIEAYHLSTTYKILLK